jgi:hypothetical protein
MKLLIFFLLLTQSLIAQDTIQFYSRIVPIAIYPDTGNFKNHTYQYIEGGISFGAVDAGITFGKLSNNNFLGFKINMDASQMGNFSNEFGIGSGWVFNGSLLLETQYTIMMRLNHYVNVGLSVNYIDISNKNFRNQYVIYGIFIRLGLSRDSNGNIDTSLRTPKNSKK